MFVCRVLQLIWLKVRATEYAKIAKYLVSLFQWNAKLKRNDTKRNEISLNSDHYQNEQANWIPRKLKPDKQLIELRAEILLFSLLPFQGDFKKKVSQNAGTPDVRGANIAPFPFVEHNKNIYAIRSGAYAWHTPCIRRIRNISTPAQ